MSFSAKLSFAGLAATGWTPKIFAEAGDTGGSFLASTALVGGLEAIGSAAIPVMKGKLSRTGDSDPDREELTTTKIK